MQWGKATVLAIVGSLAALGWGASSWQPEGAAGGSKVESHNCGGISGAVGALTSWVAFARDSTLFSHASLGATWIGNQYEAATAAPKQVEDVHYHQWRKSGGGVPDANTLQVQTWISWIEGGSAGRLEAADPQWWWTTTTTGEFPAPTVSRRMAGATEWIELSWSAIYQDEPPDYASGTTLSPDGNTARPSVSGSGGGFRGSVELPLLPDGSRFRIAFPWSVTASASCDNATVSNWIEAFHYDVISTVVDVSAEADFDLFELASTFPG